MLLYHACIGKASDVPASPPDPIKSSFADPFEAARTSIIAFWFNIAFPLERAVVR
jgi:hypothetical protein